MCRIEDDEIESGPGPLSIWKLHSFEAASRPLDESQPTGGGGVYSAKS
jgi:hypothetical protein